MTTQELNEMKLEFKEMTTKELKSYKRTTAFMSTIFKKSTVFLVMLVVIFGVAITVFLSTGASSILVISGIVHFVLYRLAIKWMPSLEKDREECNVVNAAIKEELSLRK